MKSLPLEYYEDPVSGQAAMAEVRKATGLKMSTNMCVTRFFDLAERSRVHPIDVLLGRPPLLRRLRRLPGTRPGL